MSPDIRKSDRSSDLLNIDPTDIYSVTELSQNIKQALSGNPQLNNVLLKGEITNFIKANSGHIYFNLKDEKTALACAFFRSQQRAQIENDLCDGLQIVAIGSVTTYEPRSQYQLSINKMISIGSGASAIQLKRIEEKLEGEGLFDESRKKPISSLPKKVGILASKDSAAITDILTVIKSRFPMMNIITAYVTMLGDGAPRSIIQALDYLSRKEGVDVVILARGGGPSEDLMVFNNEDLVRAICSCSKPIITGIGHEKDSCLADLAADMRASTPSTAAKAAVPDIGELTNGLSDLKRRLDSSYFHAVELERKEYEMLRDQLNFLKIGLQRSYESYLKSFEVKKKEVEIAQKEEEIKQAVESGKSESSKYKIIIVALIILLILIILIGLII